MLHFLAASAYCIMKPNKCLKQRHRWRRIFGETKGGGGGTPTTWDNGEKTLKIFQHPLILLPDKLPRKVCPSSAVRVRPENREPGSPRPPQTLQTSSDIPRLPLVPPQLPRVLPHSWVGKLRHGHAALRAASLGAPQPSLPPPSPPSNHA